MRKYTINIHWNKKHNLWSIHYRGQCHLVEQFVIQSSCVSVYKPTKKDNPRAWLYTKGNVIFHEKQAFIS